MGLNKVFIKYLKLNKSKFKYHGHVLTFGRQDIEVSQRELKDIFELPSQDSIQFNDVALFSLLGFNSVDSLEYSKMDNATIAHDLNEPVPGYLQNKFDWIIDGGTLEHCFNVLEYMSSIIRLLKPGGHILHINPCLGSCNHGFFNFQPTFYYSFYGANKFEQMNCDLVEIFNGSPVNIDGNNYDGRIIPVKNYNNLAFCTPNTVYSIFHAIKSTCESEKVIIPIQEFYYRIFKEKNNVNGGMIPDDLYMKIRGDVEENTYNKLIENQIWI